MTLEEIRILAEESIDRCKQVDGFWQSGHFNNERIIITLTKVVEMQRDALKFYAQEVREIEWEGNLAKPGTKAREALAKAEVMLKEIGT